MVFFPLCNKSYSTYSSLPLVLLAGRRELDIKALPQHFPTGHKTITKILLATSYAQNQGIVLNQCVLEKGASLQEQVTV